jgi:hypothetical protein
VNDPEIAASQLELLDQILAELRKMTAALEKVMPMLDNPATRWAAKRKVRSDA